MIPVSNAWRCSSVSFRFLAGARRVCSNSRVDVAVGEAVLLASGCHRTRYRRPEPTDPQHQRACPEQEQYSCHRPSQLWQLRRVAPLMGRPSVSTVAERRVPKMMSALSKAQWPPFAWNGTAGCHGHPVPPQGRPSSILAAMAG